MRACSTKTEQKIKQESRRAIEEVHSNYQKGNEICQINESGIDFKADGNSRSFLRLSDDETWKAYLENPFTTAIMSNQGDEESATALGILYDYYKVPMEKRIIADLENSKQEVNTVSFKNHTSDQNSNGIDQRCYNRINRDSSSGNLIVNGTYMQIPNSCEQQYSPETGYATTSSFESLDNIHCSTTTFYESLGVPDNVSSPVPASSSSSLFTNNFTKNLPIDYSGELFEYIMEAPKSLKQKENEPTMSYINKGQYYCITLRETGQRPWKYKSTQVMSVVQIVFGDSKQEEEQLRNWRYWHARQHTARQRVIDIADYKESCFVHEVDEFAHNAISFLWDINDTAKIFVSCNCLSTDFSAQKGVKGQPLSLQIDTFIGMDRSVDPIHRGTCQLKVFCDKGAERKIRDEGRKAAKKAQKILSKDSTSQAHVQVTDMNNMPTSAYTPLINVFNGGGISTTKQCSSHATNINNHVSSTTLSSVGSYSRHQSSRRMDTVFFKTMVNLSARPVHFIPDIYDKRRSTTSTLTPNSQSGDVGFFSSLQVVSSTTNPPDPDQDIQNFLPNSLNGIEEKSLQGIKRNISIDDDSIDCTPTKMKCKIKSKNEKTRVLLYVRRENDRVFDGVVLRQPTLQGLKNALEEKYHLQSDRITSIIRKSKKGLLVKVDDNIIRHYTDEDAFVMEVRSECCGEEVTHQVTLTCV